MTIDEAIQHCKEKVQEQVRKGCYSCAEEHQQLAEWLKELKAYKEQSGDEELDFVPEHKKIPCTLIIGKPCDDAISRQAAIDAFERFIHELGIEDEPYNYGEMAMSAKNVPSVTSQQRTGRWIQKEEEGEAEPFIIWECSECHCVDEDGKPSYKYCPQCGCKMQEVEE